MAALDGLKVIRSPMHGYGVIAARAFKKGERLAKVDGYLWKEEQDLDDTYSLLVDDGVLYDMLDQTRWINHSCDPNAQIDMGEPKQDNVDAYIVATRDIKEGEEIAYDYAFPAELAEPCACGSQKCRGWIVDEDEAHMVQRKAS